MFCSACGEEIHIKDRVGRQAKCPKCTMPLHTCLNCRFFHPTAYHNCLETEAEWVREKDRANFCDYFEPAVKPHGTQHDRSDEAKRKLDDLFRG